MRADQDSAASPKLLSQPEISQRIREGHQRRAYLKKGVMKRLLGNTRAIAAGVFISTVAMLGAAVEAVPHGARVRPDVLELFDGRAQVSSAFSRWGWHTLKPVNVSSDMCDPDARDGLLEWIDSSRPRLVVMSNCCPRAPPVEFIQRVFDLQLARGDHAMAGASLRRKYGVSKRWRPT